MSSFGHTFLSFSIIIITQKKKFVKWFLGKNAKKPLSIDEERKLLKCFIYTKSARRARRRAAQIKKKGGLLPLFYCYAENAFQNCDDRRHHYYQRPRERNRPTEQSGYSDFDQPPGDEPHKACGDAEADSVDEEYYSDDSENCHFFTSFLFS